MQECSQSFCLRNVSLMGLGSVGVSPGPPAGSGSAGRSRAGTAGRCPLSLGAPWARTMRPRLLNEGILQSRDFFRNAEPSWSCEAALKWFRHCQTGTGTIYQDAACRHCHLPQPIPTNFHENPKFGQSRAGRAMWPHGGGSPSSALALPPTATIS